MPAVKQRLEVHFSRLWSSFMLIGFSVFTGICVAFAINAWPDRMILFIFSIVFSGLMGYGMLDALKRLLFSPLMFIVDRKGITTFLWDGAFIKKGYYLEWDRVGDVLLEKRITAGGGSGRRLTIAIHAQKGEEIPSECSSGGSPDSSILHLDATSGSLRSQKLLEAIQALRLS